MPEGGDRLVTRGVSVRVQRAGAGPPVLFLHGAGGWPAWLPFFERLSQHYALIAPAGIRVKGVPPGDIFIWSPEEFERNRFHDQSFAAAPQAPASEEDLDIALQTRLAAVKFGWEPRLFNPDLEKWLHRINVPAHIVWGREDKILPSTYAQLWSER